MSVVPATFRSRVRAGVEPIARVFGRVGLTPNALTVIGLLIAIVGAYFAATQSWLIAGIVVAFGAIFDLFDGALARATGKVSKFGAFLDSSLDRAGEAVVYIGISFGLYIWGTGAWLAAAAMSAGFMVSYVRARAEGLGFAGGTGFASVGVAPREVRMAILVIGLLAANVSVPYSFGAPGFQYTFPFLGGSGASVISVHGLQEPFLLEAALALITVLSVVATIQRIVFTYNQSRSQNQEVSK